MRFRFVGRFFQIKAGAKSLAGAAQDQNTLLFIRSGDVNRGSQLGQQFDRERVTTLGAIQSHES